MLKALGCIVTYDGDTLTVNSATAGTFEAPENLVRERRSAFIFLGGILAKFGKAKISYPGGCELGARPIDLHLMALRKLGATITEDHGFILCEANKLTGAEIHLDFPSVGATENAMLSAVFAEGVTVINNAAREPEIEDLQKFLKCMGAKVKGAGTSRIVIQGVDKLHDAEHSVMPDRIVAGTFLTAAAITGGKIRLTAIEPEHLRPITSRLKEAGCSVRFQHDSVYLEAPPVIRPITVLKTGPHPGFPTDMQPQLMALLTKANGVSMICETVFESRNRHIPELARMGADITLSHDGSTSVIRGVEKLKGAVVESKDLRGGAALILAGLAAEGHTTVKNSSHVERGYESIEKGLSDLGAAITFVKDEN
jgi:UDP-N-acetylglucosamine 1-carboxyvinyltransferase